MSTGYIEAYSEVIPAGGKSVRRLHRLAFKDGAYYMYDYLRSGFGDENIDDPDLAELLFELLEESHTRRIARVRTLNKEVEAVVFVPRNPKEFPYVEIDNRGFPIPAVVSEGEEHRGVNSNYAWPEAFIETLAPLYQVIEQGLTNPKWQSYSHRTLGYGTLDRVSRLLEELSDLLEEGGNKEKAIAALRLADESLVRAHSHFPGHAVTSERGELAICFNKLQRPAL
jgi:hypothetical protein